MGKFLVFFISAVAAIAVGILFMLFLSHIYLLYSAGFVFIVLGVVAILLYLIKKLT